MKNLGLMTSLISALLTGCGDSPEIKLVKSGQLNACSSKTVNQMTSGFFESPQWTSFVGDDGRKYVNVTGEMAFKEKSVQGMVQFVVAADGQTFSYRAFSMNGIDQANLLGMALLRKMCESAQ